MNITINSETIDYTLEHESTLGDVVLELEKWLGEGGMQIRSIQTDGAALDLATKDSWNLRSVQDVQSVDVIAVTPMEFAAEKLQSLFQYFSTLRDATDDDASFVSELLLEREGVAALLADSLSSELARTFLIATQNQDGIADWQSGGAAIVTFARDITPVLEDRWQEIMSPQENLTVMTPALRNAIEGLGDVSAFLQSGNDSQAMEHVLTFLELAQKLMRILSVIRERKIADFDTLEIDSVPLAQCQNELNGLLTELSAAIADGDTITIGDLLEYEIGPRFGDIVSLFEEERFFA
jgi:molybdopterin converting factor small subunit